MNFVNALDVLRPGAEWSGGNNYENIIWLDKKTSKPTLEEINEKIKELEDAEPMRLLREERNKKIQETDWRATVDYPGTDQDAWLTYRQALRDLPSTSLPQLDSDGQLSNVTWPTKPE